MSSFAEEFVFCKIRHLGPDYLWSQIILQKKTFRPPPIFLNKEFPLKMWAPLIFYIRIYGSKCPSRQKPRNILKKGHLGPDLKVLGPIVRIPIVRAYMSLGPIFQHPCTKGTLSTDNPIAVRVKIACGRKSFLDKTSSKEARDQMAKASESLYTPSLLPSALLLRFGLFFLAFLAFLFLSLLMGVLKDLFLL